MKDASEDKKFLSKDGRRLSVVAFSLFSAWLISFPYEGQILYVLADRFQLNLRGMILVAMALIIAGLFCCGFFVDTIKKAKRMMLFSTIACLAGTGVFFFPPSVLWTVVLPVMAFLAANWMAAWGFYFKSCTPKNERLKTAADVLIYPFILVTPVNMAAVYLSGYLGLVLAAFLLIGALFCTFRLPAHDLGEEASPLANSVVMPGGVARPLAFLCLFIIVITIDSGLMFGVINPAFEHVVRLASWYWAVPYMAAIWMVKKLPPTVNRAYILYAAIAMIGLSFIAFIALDRSAASYLVINTMLLGACGIFDLFWWSTLGEMLDLGQNPAQILGFGLSANVTGVFFGEMIAVAAAAFGISSGSMSLLALTVVCVTFVMFPLLHKYLSGCLKNNAFLTALAVAPAEEQKEAVENLTQIEGLTERENQVALLLLKGYPYKLIAAELCVRESTVKTHIRNIYYKLNVNNKTELIKRLMK